MASRSISAPGAALALALGLAAAPAASDPTDRHSPSSDAARDARQRTATHGELESRRARRQLDRANREADAAAARRDAAVPRPRSPLQRDSLSQRPEPTVRSTLSGERRLDVARELSEVDRMLARDDLGPATRSAVERYRNELLAERAAPEAAPEP